MTASGFAVAERSGEAISQLDACRRGGALAAGVAAAAGARGSKFSIEPGSITTEPRTGPPVFGP